MSEHHLVLAELEDETLWFTDEDGVFIFDGGNWYALVNSCEYELLTIN